MGHSVHLIIGQGPALASFAARMAGCACGGAARRVAGNSCGRRAVHSHRGAASGRRPAVGSRRLAAWPVGGACGGDRGGGGLAYVETEYFGGTGAQSAMAFVDGREVVSPQSGGGAVRSIRRCDGSASRARADDEFDTVGLGERRSMADYEPEGPVRLRRLRPKEAAQTAERRRGDGIACCWRGRLRSSLSDCGDPVRRQARQSSSSEAPIEATNTNEAPDRRTHCRRLQREPAPPKQASQPCDEARHATAVTSSVLPERQAMRRRAARRRLERHQRPDAGPGSPAWDHPGSGASRRPQASPARVQSASEYSGDQKDREGE